MLGLVQAALGATLAGLGAAIDQPFLVGVGVFIAAGGSFLSAVDIRARRR